MQYVIVGDTQNFKECLVCVLGCCTKEEAEKKLEQILTMPTEKDKLLMRKHKNFKIKEVEDKDCWW